MRAGVEILRDLDGTSRGVQAASTSTFRRSTDRQVTDPNERLAIEADRRRNEELQAFEAVRFSAAAHSVPAEPLDLSDKGERLVDAMQAESYETFDADGWVRG